MRRNFNPFKFNAIETKHKGYLMRSRLEARWAVLFDYLNIKYYYEHEGYDLQGTWYLPDFWLPEEDCFIEIKPKDPTEEELHKAKLLSIASQKDVYIIAGNTHPDEHTIYAEFPPELFKFPILGEDLESRPGPKEKIEASSQILYILQKLEEASITIQAEDYSYLEIRLDKLTGITDCNFPQFIDDIKRQHDTLIEMTPFLEQYQGELIYTLSLPEGWYRHFREQKGLDGFEWFECSKCHNFEISVSDMKHFNCSHNPRGELINNTPRLLAAYEAARQARF